jgi:hypothetical protein
MQALTIPAVLGLLMLSQAAAAQESSAAKSRVPETSAAQTYTAEESAALSRAAREKTEAQERVRDRRMKSIAKGICTGC